MICRDQSTKARILARGFLILAIASTIGCAQKDWIDRTLVTENATGAWTGSWGKAAGTASYAWIYDRRGRRSVALPPMLLGGNYGGGNTSPLEGNVAGDVFTFKMLRGSASSRSEATR